MFIFNLLFYLWIICLYNYLWFKKKNISFWWWWWWWSSLIIMTCIYQNCVCIFCLSYSLIKKNGVSIDSDKMGDKIYDNRHKDVYCNIFLKLWLSLFCSVSAVRILFLLSLLCQLTHYASCDPIPFDCPMR